MSRLQCSCVPEWIPLGSWWEPKPKKKKKRPKIRCNAPLALPSSPVRICRWGITCQMSAQLFPLVSSPVALSSLNPGRGDRPTMPIVAWGSTININQLVSTKLGFLQCFLLFPHWHKHEMSRQRGVRLWPAPRQTPEIPSTSLGISRSPPDPGRRESFTPSPNSIALLPRGTSDFAALPESVMVLPLLSFSSICGLVMIPTTTDMCSTR
ncbi:hypothetical protein BDP55DRAFT_411676 [Colletotrichum godetiae]|uniref:Uncharacterized protein n=1 Tax=Colletotrichum godetiae TaxID=1209918 RepID=A0AAJ0EZD4_9PEZI|nr:uncharacterized protein BDP55DRAFT_411676 [Colletotrichum godetiae]KAK1689576.1 hypothetical protein BDP55DRAFT_411676 [Colletotrichum godetiae]